jgi:Fic family protein
LLSKFALDIWLLFGYDLAMMWQPNYHISHKILQAIREVGEVLGGIKANFVSEKKYQALKYAARELSVFASTSIEGNPLALTDVKHLLKNSPTNLRDTEKEIVNYNKALEYVYTKVRDNSFTLSITEFEKIQSIVVDNLMDNPDDIGQIRKNPVIIRDPRYINQIIFIPPDAKDVKALLFDLCEFINAERGLIDPIILAGLFHRQSVIIHPFMDGNGRTTRIITTALLGITGIDIFEIFSFENYYNQNISSYFKHVGLVGDYYDYQDNVDFTEWLEYFVAGILDELKRVQKNILSTKRSIRIPEHYDIVLNYIKEHGNISQKEYAKISLRSLAARKKDFLHMQELELIELKEGGRNTYYVLKN